MRTRRVFCAVAVCLLTLPVSHDYPTYRAPDRNAPRSIRVLFVGNSYTLYNDLPWVTSVLSFSAPGARPLEVSSVAMMGATLKEHWEDGFALKRISEGPWDYVVLQGQSQRPMTDPEEIRKYARLFDREIKAAGAKTVLFATWARRDRPEQQPVIDEVYGGLARELGAELAPVGAAWQSALAARPDLILYRDDADNHPTAAGTYLTACVIFSTIYGRSPEGLTREITDKGMRRHRFDPPPRVLKEIKGEPFELPEGDALALQRAAWDALRAAGASRDRE